MLINTIKKILNKEKLFQSSSDFIKVTIDRQSVCLGDDVMSHQKQMEVSSSISLKDFIYKLQKQYIPNVESPVAIWLLQINGINICLFNQTRSSILKFNFWNKIPDDGNVVIYLKYFAQKNINEVYNSLNKNIT